ncbi:MAG: sulfotransferase domain-containing protein [Pseudomonadota bacterium]
MIILNAGVPRSGTVLVNAIVRAVLSAQGAVSQQLNPHANELPHLIRRIQTEGVDRLRNFLVHTHSWDDETSAMLQASRHLVAFGNYRDPRDVAVSLMKLHDLDFDIALEATERYFTGFGRMTREIDLMVVPYELLVGGKRAMIFQIASHLGVWLTLERVAAIDAETSVDRHKAVMEKVQSGEGDNLKTRENRHRTLVEDGTTLINDRHIQSGAHGRWRTELSADQQSAAQERFAPLLKRYGYTD